MSVTGSITVGATSTVVAGSGFTPNETLHAHIEWRDSNGQALMNVDGYTTVDADGSVNINFGFGSQLVEMFSGKKYAKAYAKLWDNNLEVTTK